VASVSPEECWRGISPEKARAAARLVNRWGSPSRPRIYPGEDLAHAGHRQQDLIGVGVAVQIEDPLVDAGDLPRELQREASFDGDVSGQGLVVKASGSPQRQGGLGRGDDRVGSSLAPCLAGLALQSSGQAVPGRCA
jgi:hypothetical protein